MTTPTSPILPGLHPDPSICRVGDEFIIATSSCEYFPGIPLHASSDLQSWEPIGHVIDRPDQLDLSLALDSSGLWAPTIRHHEGIWYVLCTVQLDDRSRFRSFYVTATDPRAGWSDPVWLDDAVGIDPSLFFFEGRAWWTAARAARPSEWADHCEIWMRELDLDLGRLVGEEVVIWRGALLGAKWTESPHLLRRDGRFVLLTAEGGTQRNHCTVAGRADDLAGPYEPNPRNPVLTHRHLGADYPVQDVGHADLVDDADGRTWAVAHGSRESERHNLLGRETFLTPVEWEDGWPVLAPSSGVVGQHLPIPGGRGESVATLAGWSSVRGPTGFARPTTAGIELTAPTSAASPERPSTLLRALRSPEVDLAIDLELDPGAAGGLLLRRSDRHQFRVEISDTSSGPVARTILRRHGVDVVGSQAALQTRTVRIEAALRGLRITVVIDGVELTSVDLRSLSAETELSFTGVLFGPFAAEGSVLLRAWSDLPLV